MNRTAESRLVIDDAGHEVYVKRFGVASETLLALHGGPGSDHRPLNPLGRLADQGLQVVLYDQLGGGRSERPRDPSLWTLERFKAEVEAVRSKLELGAVHLFGQSWGGMLALQYTLDYPEAVKSLILSNTAASVADMVREMARLRLELRPEAFARMTWFESRGEYRDPEYEELVQEVYAHHLRRAYPFIIAESRRELAAMKDYLRLGPAYDVMWGPNEFTCTGALAGWTVKERLAELHVPTLILCGLYDEITVECHRDLAARIRDNEFVIFGNSSHMLTFEREVDAYLAVIANFLLRRRAAGSEADGVGPPRRPTLSLSERKEVV